ncbi:DUF952 domain-containing protein [Streptomyces sp. MZ04]|uniref:DUF952 domain-containing protein n=1 Tax=Streptomyces sp. MZ04 TaxID=2559236 RepID=UPI00107E8F80|nr:DUF952 domain-containing protein [Streptomyces sp. MZ04]TGB14542.1 DUF952 domain-containing protein [Streptomyces sp. MZ04]
MIYHAVPLSDWSALPDRPYAPASLAEEGFVHCSPDDATTLAVVNAFYRNAPRPLLVLCLDEDRLTARVEREAAAPAPPPGVAEGTLFPHVFGPVNRDAVERILEVEWDEEGLASGLRQGA